MYGIDRYSIKRVAVDIVRLIAPLSAAGYILTLADYTNRYPEAVPLKKITDSAAEAPLDIYGRVGIPDEVLTDQGTQFMSEYMQEISRLLSIKGLTIMSSHLVEGWSRTLKSMLKGLFQE